MTGFRLESDAVFREVLTMFRIGDAIIYGAHGVCVIADIARMKLVGDRREYFVLSPIKDANSKIYAPTDSEAVKAKMKRLLTRGEIDGLIDKVSSDKTEWISDEGARRVFCDAALKSGDRAQLMKLIEMLYLKRKSLESDKKHFHVADEKALKEAQNILHEEFSYVLGIPAQNVPEYIGERIGKAE